MTLATRLTRTPSLAVTILRFTLARFAPTTLSPSPSLAPLSPSLSRTVPQPVSFPFIPPPGVLRKAQELLLHRRPRGGALHDEGVHWPEAQKEGHALGTLCATAHLFQRRRPRLTRVSPCSAASPQLWIERINAGAREHGTSYSRFMHGLVEVRRLSSGAVSGSRVLKYEREKGASHAVRLFDPSPAPLFLPPPPKKRRTCNSTARSCQSWRCTSQSPLRH